MTTYKRDMASINASINTQNRKNQAAVNALSSHKESIRSLERRLEVIDVWDFRKHLNVLDESREAFESFKADHEKRWPPPVHLKSEPVKKIKLIKGQK